MNILVVDSDTGLQEYYTNLMEAEFKTVQINFQKSARHAMDYLPSHDVDIVITETAVGEISIFDFLEYLVTTSIPVVIISSESSERLIVETLRAGALDFVSKNNIKLGLIPHILMRALLEADRWVQIRKFSLTLPHRDAWLKLDQKTRGYLYAERQEKQRSLILTTDTEKENVFIEGKSYFIIYLYLQLIIPDSIRDSMDEREFLVLQNRLLDKFSEIIPSHGGGMWTRKEDAAFFAFPDNSYLAALLAAMKIRSDSQLGAFTIAEFSDPIQIKIGLASSKTTYREDKGQIYSEGLNLSAHLALYFPEPDSIIITSEFFEHLNPRSRKYFFRVPDQFEGHDIYKFEYVA